MASLSLKHIYKVYGNGVKAVNDFSMDIDDKEFIVFVGPSGCGKSTTLRMIAGLEDITAGELYIDDMLVNDVEPKDRDIAMVFQNYALYPHITVYENMAFGLKIRKMKNEEIHKRVLEAAEILGITEYLDRKPKEMSGGQRQRVSLGRAIVREPKVFLLDEPLSNLDAKLRTQMRSEISKLHQRLQTTFIYVTHDQTEAMTMGTRIVVMKNGFVQQIDTPRNLYNFPANKFVAGFIGTPQMNFFLATLKRQGEKVIVSMEGIEKKISFPYEDFLKISPEYLNGDKQIYIGIRAEKVICNSEYVAEHGDTTLKCTVSHVEELGDEALVYGDLSGKTGDISESQTSVVFKTDADGGFAISAGDVIDVAFDSNHLHFFDKDTECSICPRVPEVNSFDGEVSGGTLTFSGMSIKLPSAIEAVKGKVTVKIPTEAVYTEGNMVVQVSKCEVINGKTLLHLVSDGRVFFANLGKTDKTYNVGDTVKIGFDIKKIELFKDGADVCRALTDTNRLYGKISRKTVKKPSENNPNKLVKAVDFDFTIADGEIGVPDEKLKKVVTSGGMNIFKKKLRFEFSPNDVKITDDGIINGEVVKILDYGEEKFALVKVGTEEIVVKTDADVSGKVKLTPDITRLTVINDEIDVIIA